MFQPNPNRNLLYLLEPTIYAPRCQKLTSGLQKTVTIFTNFKFCHIGFAFFKTSDLTVFYSSPKYFI